MAWTQAARLAAAASRKAKARVPSLKGKTVANIQKRASATKKAVSAALSRAHTARQPMSGVIGKVRKDRADQLRANRAEASSKKK